MENIKQEPLNGLRICFIAGTLGVGGAERQLYLIISALMHLGADASLICLTSGEYWERNIKETGANYYSLGGKGSKLQRLAKIVFLLRKIKPDIVQSQHFYTNLYAAISGWFLKIISIGASRNDLKIEIRENKKFGKLSFKFPQYFVINSLQSMDYALNALKTKKKVFYLPNAVNNSKIIFRPRSHKNGFFTFLAMGRLVSQKRFDIFIEMLSQLKNSMDGQFRGIIVGSGQLEVELREQAALLELTSDDLYFVQETDSPLTYMQESDILILTSDFEGTPNVVLEAMACGLPVISTKVGNLPFFIEDRKDGFFFDGSVDNLLKIVMDLMDDKEILNEVSNNARQKIEDCFSIGVLESNLVHIYNSIINNQG